MTGLKGGGAWMPQACAKTLDDMLLAGVEVIHLDLPHDQLRIEMVFEVQISVCTQVSRPPLTASQP
jgi:hypothetical protein